MSTHSEPYGLLRHLRFETLFFGKTSNALKSGQLYLKHQLRLQDFQQTFHQSISPNQGFKCKCKAKRNEFGENDLNSILLKSNSIEKETFYRFRQNDYNVFWFKCKQMMKNYDFLSYCDFLMLLELCRGCRSPGVENPRDSSRLKDKVFSQRSKWRPGDLYFQPFWF